MIQRCLEFLIMYINIDLHKKRTLNCHLPVLNQLLFRTNVYSTLYLIIEIQIYNFLKKSIARMMQSFPGNV